LAEKIPIIKALRPQKFILPTAYAAGRQMTMEQRTTIGEIINEFLIAVDNAESRNTLDHQ